MGIVRYQLLLHRAIHTMMLKLLLLFTGYLLVQGCEDKWWCAERIESSPRDCYIFRNVCCASCKKHYTGVEGCEWGNKNGDDWCSHYYYVGCEEASYREGCCQTCSKLETTPPPQPIPTFKPQPSYKPDTNNHGSCGHTPIQPNLNGFIVGGVEARPNSLPWQVGFGEVGWGQSCGGSIINKKTVITAAHCIKPGKNYYVVVGQHKEYGYYDKYYKEHRLSQVIVHPEYTSLQKYDIALLKTTEDIEFNDGVQPICLPPADQTYGEDRTMFLASGWGSMGDSYATKLMQVALPYVSQEKCQYLLGSYYVHEAVICAGFLEGGKSTCYGDSGGPLATIINDRWTLAAGALVVHRG